MNALKRANVKSDVAKRIIDRATRSFGPNGNLTGMRKYYGWDRSHPVKIGAYVYDAPKELYDLL